MLRDIIQYASEVTGIVQDSSNSRAQLLRYINRAASEMYNSWDLPNSVTESTFDLSAISQNQDLWRATFPWFVDELRAARYPTITDKITIKDLRPKYLNRPWKQPLLQWNLIGRTPLMQNLAVESSFTFTLTRVETDPVEITVVGETADASHTREVVVIQPGELTVNGTFQWVTENPFGVKSISKNGVTQSDVVVTNTTDGTILAVIPNRMPEAKNLLIQFHDEARSLVDTSVEILYKRPFIPLYDDTDNFVEPKVETALNYKIREHWFATKQGVSEYDIQSAISQATAAKALCSDILQRVCTNIESETEKTVGFAPNPYESAPLKIYPFRNAYRT